MLTAQLPRGAGYALLGACGLGLVALLLTTVNQAQRSAQSIGSEPLASQSNGQRIPLPVAATPKRQGQQFFVDGIPEQQFDSLTVEDLPNISLDRDTKVRRYNGEYITISSWEAGRKIIKVKKVGSEAILSGVQNPWNPSKGVADDGYETPLPLITDFEVVGDRLFLAASHQGVYEVDLTTNTISGVYGPQEGLSNLINLKLETDGSNLWIGTFDGAGVLDPLTKKIRFFRSELLSVPCSDYGTTPHVRMGVVWMQIAAHDGCQGGLSQYNPASGAWTPHSPTDPSNQKDGDEGSEHPVYATAADEHGNSYIREYRNGTLENLLRIDGRVYFALARKGTDTIYLMSSGGIEKLSRTDAFPQRIIPIARGTAPLLYNRLLLSQDGTHLVSVGMYQDEYAGSFTDYDVDVADISGDSPYPAPLLKKFHFEGQDNEKIDNQFDPESLSKLTLKTVPHGYELSGLPRTFKVNLEKKTITTTL